MFNRDKRAISSLALTIFLAKTSTFMYQLTKKTSASTVWTTSSRCTDVWFSHNIHTHEK